MKKKRVTGGVFSQLLLCIFLTSLKMGFAAFSPIISTSLPSRVDDKSNIPASINEILEVELKPQFSKMDDRLNKIEGNFLALINRVDGQEQEISLLKSIISNIKNQKETDDSTGSGILKIHHKREERQMLYSLEPQCNVEPCNFDESNQEQQDVLTETITEYPPKSVVKKPSSCEDLKSMGHSLNGFYLTQARGENGISLTNKIMTVFCDFSKKKVGSSTNLKVEITEKFGYVDMETLPHGVRFYVQRNSTVPEKQGVNITFQVEVLNIGGAMDLTTGVFTAPVPGKYFLSFSAIKGNNLNGGTEVYLYHNNELVGAAYGTTGKKTTLALQSVLQLKQGDKIYLQKGLGDTILFEKLDYEKHERTTHFTGWLLEESSKF